MNIYICIYIHIYTYRRLKQQIQLRADIRETHRVRQQFVRQVVCADIDVCKFSIVSSILILHSTFKSKPTFQNFYQRAGGDGLPL